MKRQATARTTTTWRVPFFLLRGFGRLHQRGVGRRYWADSVMGGDQDEIVHVRPRRGLPFQICGRARELFAAAPSSSKQKWCLRDEDQEKIKRWLQSLAEPGDD